MEKKDLLIEQNLRYYHRLMAHGRAHLVFFPCLQFVFFSATRADGVYDQEDFDRDFDLNMMPDSNETW